MLWGNVLRKCFGEMFWGNVLGNELGKSAQKMCQENVQKIFRGKCSEKVSKKYSMKMFRTGNKAYRKKKNILMEKTHFKDVLNAFDDILNSFRSKNVSARIIFDQFGITFDRILKTSKLMQR